MAHPVEVCIRMCCVWKQICFMLLFAIFFNYLHQLFDIHFHNNFYSLLLIAFVLMEGIFVKYSSLLHVLRLCRAASEDKNCRKIKRNEDSKHFTLEVCQWMLANKPIINNWKTDKISMQTYWRWIKHEILVRKTVGYK